MPTHCLTVFQGSRHTTLNCQSELSILENLRNAGISSIHAPCGGKGLCKQCRVQATGTVRALADGTRQQVNSQELLACCYAPDGDCTVILPESGKMEVLTHGAETIRPCGSGLGIAVDIGTTTVAVYLYDLSTGSRLSVQSGRNAQRPFGADVISRIQICETADGLDKLCTAIRRQLSEMINRCCLDAGRLRSEITRLSIAGNTVMEHIFMHLSPVSIGVAPFRTLSLFGEASAAADLFSGLAPGALLYLCPALAGYVGGDITAGLLASGASESADEVLFLDIGTNGEMGVGSAQGFTCCATAAGPAFEGAEIECGMDGSAGAISRVWLDGDQVRFSVIGNEKAAGICGSGLIDALCTMLRCGAVQENGRMSRPNEVSSAIAPLLRPDADDRMRFYLTEDVYITGEDVRQLQMAKSAIRAGIETLLAKRGLRYSDISQVIIAGGFGAFMDVKSACAIGLLPPVFSDRTRHAGNTAGGGAALALSPDGQAALHTVADKCSYLELSGSSFFMEKYIESMIFDEIGEVFA